MKFASLFILLMSLAACGEPWEGYQSHPKQHAEAPVSDKSNDVGAVFHGGTWGTLEDRAMVEGWVKKLMDEPHDVPSTAAKAGGKRGSPGSSEKLTGSQMYEVVSTIIHGGQRFLPASLSPKEKWALVTVQMSLESAFVVGSSGVNPGDNSKVSVSLLQITIPGMWDDIFRKNAKIPGLTHYDGSPWNPADTTNEQIQNSIWDGCTSALWCIAEQGRRGVPDWFGGPDGPMPRIWRNALLAWVIGGPALKSGGDLAGQRDAYIAIQQAELAFIGMEPKLLETEF